MLAFLLHLKMNEHILIRDVTEPAKSQSDADADLLPDQNSLVPAIIVTAIQFSYFCLRL